MNIHILDKAKQDLIDGYYFYETQKTGVGDYFYDSVFADIDSLVLYAGIHKQVFDYYCMLAKRFPFAIYYKMQGSDIFVYAVLDCRQSPRGIRKRLD